MDASHEMTSRSCLVSKDKKREASAMSACQVAIKSFSFATFVLVSSFVSRDWVFWVLISSVSMAISAFGHSCPTCRSGTWWITFGAGTPAAGVAPMAASRPTQKTASCIPRGVGRKPPPPWPPTGPVLKASWLIDPEKRIWVLLRGISFLGVLSSWVVWEEVAAEVLVLEVELSVLVVGLRRWVLLRRLRL